MSSLPTDRTTAVPGGLAGASAQNQRGGRGFVFFAALFVAAVPAVFGQANPVKLAGFARFDLNASASVGALNGGQFTAGSGSFSRQTWLPAAVQPRTYSAQFNIVRFAWLEAAFQFTPQSNGTVTVQLMGQWEQPPGGGAIYRQEVLWDNLRATGSTLNNGSFEQLSGTVPTGWTRPYGDAGVTNFAPVHGTNVVRVWHDGPLQTTLTVTGGVPVTLRFWARALVPAGFPEMARLGSNTPAHTALLKFRRGANLGNYLEAPPNSWGTIVYTTNDFARMKAEGFDHVRLPIGWQYYTGPGPSFTLSKTIFAKADALVTNALNAGLAVLVNMHHFDDFTTDPAGQSNRFYAIWEQVAAHYSNSPPAVAFELLNEPKDAATTAIMSPIYAEAIRRIRLTNPERTIFVGPGRWNSLDEVPSLTLPDHDANLVVTVHCYDPFLFTHQGASWTLPDTATTGIVYPGPPATPLTPHPSVTNNAWIMDWFNRYNTLPAEQNPCSTNAYVARLEIVRLWSEYYGRPIHLGEFGAYSTADAASRARYYRDLRAAAEACNFGWAIWDWKAGFYYWNNSSNAPAPGLRDALFPRPKLRALGPGHFDYESAAGKTFLIERAADPRTGWSAIATQQLTVPRGEFADPQPPSTRAFYRLQWLREP
jgi:endoglucanase